MQALDHVKGRTLTGIVISDKNDKTIVVRVETLVKHPLLKKYIRRRKKFTAHDPTVSYTHLTLPTNSLV